MWQQLPACLCSRSPAVGPRAVPYSSTKWTELALSTWRRRLGRHQRRRGQGLVAGAGPGLSNTVLGGRDLWWMSEPHTQRLSLFVLAWPWPSLQSQLGLCSALTDLHWFTDCCCAVGDGWTGWRLETSFIIITIQDKILLSCLQKYYGKTLCM